MTIPTTEPASLQAGDTLRWQRSLPDYPASDGWVLSYRLINAAARIDIVAAADGDTHSVLVPATTSASYAAGDYTWTAHVTRATERYTVGRGALRVLPDLAAATTNADGRTPAQRALADLRTALLGWLSSQGHVAEYEIAGRRMRFASAAEIQTRIAIAEREVSREAAALGLAGSAQTARRVLVRY